jgi:SAM-dependent methyltransferase
VDDADVIAKQMAAYAKSPEVQIAQTRFRLQLLRNWLIPVGARVLEIGCGQGDMTAVLAHVVGDDGYVTAVDAAGRNYGGPVSIGESADHLSRTPLGRRVEFHFNFDLLDQANDFRPDAFDYVVFAHCSWYFSSLDHFRRALLRVRPWAKRLCYSEWDLEPRSLDQVAHMLAVLIRGQVEAYRHESIANVRTPFSKSSLEAILHETGWMLSSQASIDSGCLQDGRWEIDNCLNLSPKEASDWHLPPKLIELLGSQFDLLRSLAAKHALRSLSSYSIVAARIRS